MSVLVAYASKFGSTAEIAEAVAGELRTAGVEVGVLDAAKVKDVRDYEAVVLGSGLYAFRWRREAVRMLRTHRRKPPNTRCGCSTVARSARAPTIHSHPRGRWPGCCRSWVRNRR